MERIEDSVEANFAQNLFQQHNEERIAPTHQDTIDALAQQTIIISTRNPEVASLLKRRSLMHECANNPETLREGFTISSSSKNIFQAIWHNTASAQPNDWVSEYLQEIPTTPLLASIPQEQIQTFDEIWEAN